MQTGNFGRVREAYAAVRKGVPQEVLDRFWELVPQAHPRILDLGSGTGISTRQLAENALLHIQSAGVWNEVPKDKEKEALELMKEHILENKINGRILRQVKVQAVSGMKK